MHFGREQALFENRYDAGRQLAAQLGEYKGQSVVVLAIPNGGVPVALEVALALEADLDLVISRKFLCLSVLKQALELSPMMEQLFLMKK